MLPSGQDSLQPIAERSTSNFLPFLMGTEIAEPKKILDQGRSKLYFGHKPGDGPCFWSLAHNQSEQGRGRVHSRKTLTNLKIAIFRQLLLPSMPQNEFSFVYL